LTYNGIIDLRQGPGSKHLQSPNVCRISDHKTCAGAEWSMGPEELREDPQSAIYAAYAYSMPQTETVELQWTYGDKSTLKGSNADAWPVEIDMSREESEQRMAELDETSTMLLLVRLLYPLLSANDLPKQPTACAAVGKKCWNVGGCVLHKRAVPPREKLLALLR